MIYNVKDDPILQVSSQEPSTSSKSQTYLLSAKSYPILIELLLIFNQSTKFQSHSSAELSLFGIVSKIYTKQPLADQQVLIVIIGLAIAGCLCRGGLRVL